MRDDRYPDYEGHQVANYFRGKDWSQITLKTLCQEYQGDAGASHNFMVPEGFCYYLPSFLLMALEPEGDDIAFSLAHHLMAPAPHEMEDLARFRARVERLSTDERAAVTCTLRYLAERYDREGLPDNPARAALERYWEPLSR